MIFNLLKSVYLRIINKLHPLVYSYYMSNIPIQQADHAKYLGVIIDKNLNWNEHTKQVVSKANSVRGFLQCTKKCSPDVKASCYLMLVHLMLEYACVYWSPYHQCNIHAIVMVQRYAARNALYNYDRCAGVSEMIVVLGWPTLESSRNILRTVMMYKIMNKLVDVPSDASNTVSINFTTKRTN